MLGTLTLEDLDEEADGMNLEEMQGRFILQEKMNDLARQHTEMMWKGKKRGLTGVRGCG